MYKYTCDHCNMTTGVKAIGQFLQLGAQQVLRQQGYSQTTGHYRKLGNFMCDQISKIKPWIKL